MHSYPTHCSIVNLEKRNLKHFPLIFFVWIWIPLEAKELVRWLRFNISEFVLYLQALLSILPYFVPNFHGFAITPLLKKVVPFILTIKFPFSIRMLWTRFSSCLISGFREEVKKGEQFTFGRTDRQTNEGQQVVKKLSRNFGSGELKMTEIILWQTK